MSAAATPLDLRLGLTDAAAVAHPLRWGIIGTGSISAQWVASLAQCPGACHELVRSDPIVLSAPYLKQRIAAGERLIGAGKRSVASARPDPARLR